MKISPRSAVRRHGFLEVDMLVALAILVLAIVPVGFAFNRERQALKNEYLRAAANEIVDGEMEILLAGAGKNFPDGAQRYSVAARSAAELPPGTFELTKRGRHLRLAWTPASQSGVSAVTREGELR